MEFPRNRKQRRAAAAAATAPAINEEDASSIPLARPSEDTKPKGKTLYEVIAERQKELLSKEGLKGKQHSASESSTSGPSETQFVTVDRAGKIVHVADPSKTFDGDGDGDVEGIGSKGSSNGGSSGKQQQKQGGEKEKEEEEGLTDLPPLIDTLLLSTTLTTLHLTLAYLAAHQYAQEIPKKALFHESAFIAFPILSFLIHLAHGHIISFSSNKPQNKTKQKQQTISLFPLTPEKLTISFLRKLLFPPSLRTCVFLPLAVFLGDKLMTMTNEDSYYAVMKSAPAMGTLWVWCVLEMSVGAAVIGALGPLGWGVFWKGYGIL